MVEQIERIFQINIQLVVNLDKAVYYFRTQNYDTGLRLVNHILVQISSFLNKLMAEKEYFNQGNRLVDEDLLMGMLQCQMEAQENKDYLLLADLYELQLIPYLLQLQEAIIQKENSAPDFGHYLENLKILQRKDRELYERISTLPPPLTLAERGYLAEYTACGLPTMAILEKQRRYYLHSNNQVIREAFTLALSWYSLDKSQYIIYGLGLGYHIRELRGVSNSITITVYESDLNVIQAAFAFSDMKSMLHNNIELVYDPDFSKLVTAVSLMDQNTEFFIHYPSLRNIKSTIIKEKLENYFIQQSSIRNQGNLLMDNFRDNILHYNSFIDDLKEAYQDRDLYIVAAGPSLDKNFQQLKEVGEKGIILATGTVFKKLMNAGIKPDYVLVTDPNARVYKQIAGLESCDVPMLYLSTAYKGFAANYKGKKYLICQKNYPQAEEFARKQGLMLFQTGGSVSTTALDIGISFGCSRIIFLGLDLAYTDNYAHAKDTSRRDATQIQDMRQVEDLQGNLINTSRSLDIFRVWIEARIRDVKGIEFIDATEGGAKIKGMRIAKLKELLS